MKVGKLKQLSKKSLSVLLAVIMIMTSMSVAFSTVSFAAGGNVSDAKWNELIAALKNDTVKNAVFTSTATNNYVVNDPDGKIIDAVELYFEIFDTLADKAPANSSAGNRTINQVNTTIKNTLSNKMSGDYATFNVDSFITRLISGANVSDGKGSKQEVKNSNSAPGTNLSAVADVKLTVTLGGELLSYDSIDELPASIATTKTFTVKHTNTKYDTSTRTENTTDSCGNVTGTDTYYGFEYFYSISSVTEAEGEKQSTQVLKDSATTLSNNSTYLNANLDQMVQFAINDAAALANAKTAINNAKNNAVNFSSAAWNQYFSADYDAKISTFNSNFTLASEIVSVGEVAYPLTGLKEAGYAGMDETQLRALYSKLTEGLATFDGASSVARDYIANHKYNGVEFVRDDIKAFADEVLVEIRLVELRRLKADIDNTIPAYYDYNEDDIINGILSGATVSVAKGKVDGFITSINSYPANLVNMVMSGYTDTLGDLSADLAYLVKVANYDEQFSAKYAKYIAEIYEATDVNAESAALVEVLKGYEGVEGYDSWYTGLKNLIASIEADLEEGTADKIMQENDEAMKARMESVYATLHSRVEAQIDIATELYAAVSALNGKIDILNINNYSKYKQAFKSIDTDTYYYLKDEAKNFSMPQATINKFNALSDDFTILENFIATGGFSSFSQILGDYANREVLPTDIIRDEEYIVNKDKVENVISSIDTLIASDEVKAILGGLLNEDGAPLDIGTMLKDLVAEALFSDALINTIMQMLYPLVLGELLKVWEKDLPTKITDPVTANITYNKTIDQIAVEAGLPLFPSDVANTLDSSKYADNIAMLKTASKNYVTTKKYEDPEDPNKITEVVVDQTPWTEENPALFNEDGTLKLTWGVDAAKEAGKSTDEIAEAFYQGFDDALHCLKPLLNVLVANTAWESNQVRDVASISAKVIFTINDNAHLTIGASACAGYANLLVPIFEALGARVEGTEGAAFTFKAPSVIEDYAKNSENAAADMLRAIFEPVFGLLDSLGKAPLATIINILPNLCYALSMQMVPSLLGMLGTTLNIGVQLNNSTLQNCVGGMLADLLPSMDLNVAELIGDINELIDLSDGVNSLLGLLGLPLPAIEQGKIAQMGTMDEFTSARYATHYDKAVIKNTTGVDLAENEALTIAADKGAVGNYLLQYILGVIEDEEAFKGLLGMLMTVEQEDGTKIPDEEKIAETIASFDEIGLFKYGKNNAIAAIVELFNNDNFSFGEYVWYEGAIYDGSTVTNLTPAMIAYLSYGSDLTKGKAQYIVDHLDELIGSILDMVNGNEEGTFSIADKLAELIGGLFSNETITSLAKALSVIDINALLAGSGEADEPETVAEGEDEEAATIDVNALITDLLGIDLTPFAAYADLADDTDWGVTDGATFAAALAQVLEPFGPVIDFILKGSDLKVIYDAAKPAITLKGYNGYDSAIVPILEALGLENIPTMGADDDALVVILNAVLDLLDTVIGTDAEGNPVDAVEGILNILPGLLYFLQSNGLTTAVNNLLIPVYQILDTIRPIYELDLNELLGTLLADAGITLDLNNLTLDVNFVLDLVKTLTGLDLAELGVLIEDVCKIAVTDYTSASSVIGEDGKKGAYTGMFDSTDLVAVIINFALDWARDEDNVNALAALIGGEDAEKVEKVKTYIAGIYDLIAGIEPEYVDVNWAYKFPEGFDEAIFSSGISIAPTIESLTYPTDWTEDTAKYLDENLDLLINTALELAGVEGTLGDMLKSKINFFTGANLNAIVTLLTDLLGKLNTEIVNNAGVLIGADLDALKAYKVDDEATFTTVEFAQELAKILGVIPEVVNLVFFADDFTLFNKADGTPAATIKGGRGYAKGLALILEALGCKDLPAEDEATVEAVLVSLANRFDEILNNPVSEILDVLPNIIYFLNANGIGAAVNNMLACVTGFMAQLKDSFGVEVDLFAIINDALNGLLPEDSQATIDVRNLDLATVFTLVEELLGLDLSAASDILVNFCVGKINPYTSVSGEYGFKMEYNDDYARYDMITILVTVALMLVENEENAKALDEMIGTDIISALKTVFGASEIKYSAPNWNYPLADNGTVDAMKYSITYPNNWTEETAVYVTEKLPEIADMIAGMVDSNYTSLAALLQDKVNVFTADTLNDLVALITDLLGDIDEGLITAAGLLLNVDVAGLKNYKAPETVDTTEEFAAELANVLNTYAKGVVEWLLLGRDYTFFVDETKMVEGLPYAENEADGKAIITITGAQGYAEGLALLLEALGCKNLPDVYAEELTSAEVVEATLASVAARIDAILADPVIEILALLPNLLYFLNTNGVAAVVDNLTAAITALLDKLSVFGLEVDINELINIQKLMGIEGKGATIDLDNLALADILQAVSLMVGLDLTLIEDVLVGFALGKVEAYDSISTECGETKKMLYADEFDTYDMVTVLANLVILTIADENNAEFVKDLAGEDIYGVIAALLNLEEAPVQEFSWLFEDKADTGYVFSAISASDFYGGEVYGDIYTEEMAQYIADNFGEFVDNIIYLLGINIDGKSINNLKDLLNGLVNGSLYNSENVIAIRDALAGVLASLKGLEVNGKNVGQYIAAVLKAAEIADLDAVAAVEVESFTEDREKFVAALCDVLEPLYGVLRYLLADEDFAFFVDLDKNNAITLKGAEGYAYGIIPLLETLGCEGILTPAEYYAAIEADGDVLLTSILTPLLDRVDVILADPAEEILNMLPNLIYFINSNGVDTVVKNTLNAVYTLLNAIEPIAKIDLYELIGLDLSTLTFEKLFNMLLDMIADSTGYAFSTLDASAIVELSVGTLESYTSKNGKKAYRMVYASVDEIEGGKTEMVTVVERLLLTFIMHENNREMLIGLLKDNLGMTADGEKYLRALLKLIADCTLDTKLGMETALATIYYIYYGADIGVGESANGLKDLNAEWTKILADMRNSKDEGEVIAGNIIAGILDLDIFEDIVDPDEGIAPNGLIAFFQKIIEFFKSIGDWFRNLFN